MIVTKFRENAWMVLVAVPLLVVCFVLLHRHHRRVREELGTRSPVPADAPRLAVVLYLERLDAAAEEALAFVGGLRGPELHALYAGEGGATGPLAERWSRLTGRELEPLPAADSPVAAVSSYVERISRSANGLVDVVVPELFETRSLRSALRRTTAFRLAAALHGDPRVVVTHVPVLVDSPRLPQDASTTTEALVLVPGLGDATSQAVRYAGALGVARTRAVHVALDADEAERVRREWAEWRMPLPLEVVDAPFRSLKAPVLETVRAITARPGTIAAVLVPEVASGSWWRDGLPQRALPLPGVAAALRTA